MEGKKEKVFRVSWHLNVTATSGTGANIVSSMHKQRQEKFFSNRVAAFAFKDRLDEARAVLGLQTDGEAMIAEINIEA